MITIGLDFGTHQTKICIENANDPQHMTYEFYRWPDGSYALPSVIQINVDHTISYGSINLEDCLVAQKLKKVEKPVPPIFPDFPEGDLGAPPVAPKYPPKPSSKFTLNDFSQLQWAESHKNGKIKAWEQECKRLEEEHRIRKKRYEQKLRELNIEQENWNNECTQLTRLYANRIEEYEKSVQLKPLVFRYFKQATFSSYQWRYEVKPEALTVLYLANIFFILGKRFGKDFAVQMGVPASKDTFDRLKKKASGILIQAFRLVDEVFDNDYERFLKTPFETLLNIIPPFEYSDDLKVDYGLIILPEAFAALKSVTANSKIPKKLTIMADVGGGTTDLSFFLTADNNEPHIYNFESIPKGLNYFLEFGNEEQTQDVTHKRELEEIEPQFFNKALETYRDNIHTSVKKLTDFLHTDTIKRGVDKSAFPSIILNNPIIYTGGGSYDSRLKFPIGPFTDIKSIDKQMLAIPNIVEESEINMPFSVLATSYGLAISCTNDDIKISNKEDLFNHLQKEDKKGSWYDLPDYGLYSG